MIKQHSIKLIHLFYRKQKELALSLDELEVDGATESMEKQGTCNVFVLVLVFPVTIKFVNYYSRRALGNLKLP